MPSLSSKLKSKFAWRVLVMRYDGIVETVSRAMILSSFLNRPSLSLEYSHFGVQSRFASSCNWNFLASIHLGSRPPWTLQAIATVCRKLGELRTLIDCSAACKLERSVCQLKLGVNFRELLISQPDSAVSSLWSSITGMLLANLLSYRLDVLWYLTFDALEPKLELETGWWWNPRRRCE